MSPGTTYSASVCDDPSKHTSIPLPITGDMDTLTASNIQDLDLFIPGIDPNQDSKPKTIDQSARVPPSASNYDDFFGMDLDYDSACIGSGGCLSGKRFSLFVEGGPSGTVSSVDTLFSKNTDLLGGTLSPVSSRSPRSSRTGSFGNLQALCSQNQGSCTNTALSILNTLHSPISTCLNASSTGSSMGQNPSTSRKLDMVLATNRESVHRLSNILQCSCSSSGQLPLLCTIICCKLSTWYRAIINSVRTDNTIPSPSNPSINVQHQRHFDLDQTLSKRPERVSHQPLKVGSFAVDSSLQTKLCAQLVYHELLQLEKVTDLLCARLETPPPSNDPQHQPHPTSQGIDTTDSTFRSTDPVHTALCTSLRQQIQNVVSETRLILKS